MNKAQQLLTKISESRKIVEAQQYWIVKQGTKEVINGPYSSQGDAEKDLAKAPIGGQMTEIVQGNYLGNNTLE